jgi:phosphoribosyl 1,2-cyclic phosphate phosphodiesterase
MITTDSGKNLLVDTPPEMRVQLLSNKVMHVEGILYTHAHADHIFGLDDIRTFNYRQKCAMPLYVEESVEADIRRIYDYIFRPTQIAGGKPQVEFHVIRPNQSLNIHGTEALPLRVMHGKLPILGFKFGPNFAYVTDVNEIPEPAWSHLKNIDTLILDAVRYEPHETHFHMDAALEVVSKLKPKNTFFTHLSHDYDHETLNKRLPAGIQLAYDGQVIELAD